MPVPGPGATQLCRACRAPRWHLLATTWLSACSSLTPATEGGLPALLSGSENWTVIIFAATGVISFWSEGTYKTQGQWKGILKTLENLKGRGETVSAGAKGRLHGGAFIPQGLLLGSAPSLGSSRPVPSNPTLPTPRSRPWHLPEEGEGENKLTTPGQRQTGDSAALKHSPLFFSRICRVLDDHLALWFYEYSYIRHLEMQEAICIKISTQWLPFSVPLRDINMYFFPLMYK